MKYSDVRKKLIIILVVILIPAFLALSLINFYFQRDAVRQELVKYSLPMVRELINWEITTRLKDPLLAASLMAHDTFVLDWVLSGEEDMSKISDYLEKIKTEHGFASAFMVSYNTKNYYSFVGLHKRVSPQDAHDIWYYNFIESGKTVDYDVDTDEVSGEVLTVFINHRLEDTEGNLLGVIGVGLDMSNLTDLLVESQERYGKTIYLVDRTGTVQAHSDHEVIEKEQITTNPGILEISRGVLNTRKGNFDGAYTGEHGRILLTSKYIEGVDWYVIVEQDEQQVMEETVSNLIRTLLIGVGISLLTIIVSTYFITLSQKQIVKAMITDHLTGIFNRIHLDTLLEEEIEVSLTRSTPFSILLFDIDHFKRFNDTYGHAVGDLILKGVSHGISSHLQDTEYFGRWGGDEFMILLPGRDLSEAAKKAEELKSLMAEYPYSIPETPTLSFGVTECQGVDTLKTLVQRADQALYRAKRGGKNAVFAQKADLI